MGEVINAERSASGAAASGSIMVKSKINSLSFINLAKYKHKNDHNVVIMFCTALLI